MEAERIEPTFDRLPLLPPAVEPELPPPLPLPLATVDPPLPLPLPLLPLLALRPVLGSNFRTSPRVATLILMGFNPIARARPSLKPTAFGALGTAAVAALVDGTAAVPVAGDAGTAAVVPPFPPSAPPSGPPSAAPSVPASVPLAGSSAVTSPASALFAGSVATGASSTVSPPPLRLSTCAV